MFSSELALIIEAAVREAYVMNHAYFSLEHLLYAMLHEGSIEEVVRACGAEPRKIIEEVKDYLGREIETRPEGDRSEPIHTLSIQRSFERAIRHIRSAGKMVISPLDMLVSVIEEEESHASFFLNKYGVRRADVVRFISHGISKLPEIARLIPTSIASGGSTRRTRSVDEVEEEQSEQEMTGDGMLATFADDLTERARKGEFDPVIGREKELERIILILSRRTKNNPLLLGEAGVGKTSLSHALAERIVKGNVPQSLKGARLFSVDMGSLVAGTKFRGEFEERLKLLVQEITELPKAILFIDEIHTIIGAGATTGGALDASNILKPALSGGKLRCMGSTTHDEYKKGFLKDRALNRRFSTVEIAEPSIDDAVAIVRGLKTRFEEHHGVTFSDRALSSAVTLSARYIRDRSLPDKAIDLIDEAGAAAAMNAGKGARVLIDEQHIEEAVSRIVKAPVKKLSGNEAGAIRDLERRLGDQIFGQEKAISAVVRAVKRSRANLQNRNRPTASFLFAGPTGVGKTELARVLAAEMQMHFHRFDMSEYMEKHAVARLIGAPPGYVGYEEGGSLTELVRKQPYAVLLFDEIEKAHADIYQILLQVLDDASLTDSQGRKTDFRQVIVILTTNAGSDRSGGIGFGATGQGGAKEAALKEFFKPEFRNRLDEIVSFEPLPLEVVLSVVDKFIKELVEGLTERQISLSITQDAKEWLAKKGYDPVLGARPMSRMIQTEISDPLADELLFGALVNGGTVSIGLGEDRLTFACTPAAAESKSPQKRIAARRATPSRRAIRGTV
jgi:ATP-dependent Clp protease ATP-binding subunit ClpA